MADNTLKVRLQSAYKSSADWNTLNPVLKNGEVGFVSSPASMYGWYKIGNGTSTWNQLPYSTYRPLNNGDFDTINVTDETAGDLIVTGVARFLNTIQGTAASAVNAGTASSASNAAKVAGTLTITQAGTTKLNAWNGSAATSIALTDNNTTYKFASSTSGATGAIIGLKSNGASTFDTGSTVNLATTSIAYPIINALTTGSTQATTADYLIGSYAGAGTPTTSWWRKQGKLITVGRAVGDESGNNIKATYASSISMDNHTLTLKNKNGASLAAVDLHFDDLKSLIHKKYESTSYYATATDWTNSTWYFMSVKPDSWYKPWRVKFKVHSYCPNYANIDSYTWATYTGRADAIAYCNWNERYDPAHYYLPYYPLKKAGFDAGYGHAIGISILYGASYTSSAYYRTFEIDYYECENCTVTILDTPVKWSSWTGTGTTNYGSLGGPDAYTRGLRETGDDNTTTENRIGYFPGKTGAKGIWATSLFMEDANGTYQDICTASDGTVTSNNRTTATTKIANTNGFKVGGTIWYTNTTYAANTNIAGNGVVYSSISLFDSRYAFNTTLTANSLTPYKEVYLVGTIHDDNLFYLDTVWWTQTPTDTSKIYVLVGACFDSTTSNCRVTLYEQNIWYYYDGTMLQEYVHKAKNADYATSAGAAPIPGVDRGLNVVSSKIGHATSLTASANISGTAAVSGWGQVATVAVPSIDAYGHTTACKTKTITMPSSTGLATTAYVNERVANAVHFKGGFNPSNADALKTPAKEIGDMYVATAAGTFYSLALESGDSIIFQATVAANTNPTSADFIGVEKTVSVEDKGPTLSWGNTSTVGAVEGVNLTVKMPSNPNTDTKVTSVSNHYTPSSSDTLTPTSGGTTTNISGTVVNYIAGLQKDAAGHITGLVSSSIKADANTDTKVTSVGNHYTPSSSGTFSPVAGGTTTDISTTTLNIITGLQKDAAGHITGVVSGSIKATNTPNTDEKLKMTPASVTKFYPAGNPNSTSAVTTAYYSTAVSITGATVSGGTFSGNKVHANAANSGNDGGVALYSTVVSDYGVAMRQTANSGKHGGVQGDWAIYNWMAGATNRGFIWKNSSTAVASIDCAGNEVLNGALTVGGSSANNTGVTLQFNSTTKSLDFVFT